LTIHIQYTYTKGSFSTCAIDLYITALISLTNRLFAWLNNFNSY